MALRSSCTGVHFFVSAMNVQYEQAVLGVTMISISTISTFHQKRKGLFSICDLSPGQDQWVVPGQPGEEIKYI